MFVNKRLKAKTWKKGWLMENETYQKKKMICKAPGISALQIEGMKGPPELNTFRIKEVSFIHDKTNSDLRIQYKSSRFIPPFTYRYDKIYSILDYSKWQNEVGLLSAMDPRIQCLLLLSPIAGISRNSKIKSSSACREEEDRVANRFSGNKRNILIKKSATKRAIPTAFFSYRIKEVCPLTSFYCAYLLWSRVLEPRLFLPTPWYLT